MNDLTLPLAVAPAAHCKSPRLKEAQHPTQQSERANGMENGSSGGQLRKCLNKAGFR
jgi:hypothetical protein